MVTAEDDDGDEDDEDEPEDRGEGGDRLQPKRADEQLCPSCFLLVRADRARLSGRRRRLPDLHADGPTTPTSAPARRRPTAAVDADPGRVERRLTAARRRSSSPARRIAPVSSPVSLTLPCRTAASAGRAARRRPLDRRAAARRRARGRADGPPVGDAGRRRPRSTATTRPACPAMRRSATTADRRVREPRREPGRRPARRPHRRRAAHACGRSRRPTAAGAPCSARSTSCSAPADADRDDRPRWCVRPGRTTSTALAELEVEARAALVDARGGRALARRAPGDRRLAGRTRSSGAARARRRRSTSSSSATSCSTSTAPIARGRPGLRRRRARVSSASATSCSAAAIDRARAARRRACSRRRPAGRPRHEEPLRAGGDHRPPDHRVDGAVERARRVIRTLTAGSAALPLRRALLDERGRGPP